MSREYQRGNSHLQHRRFKRMTEMERVPAMFYAIALILLAAWILGLFNSYTMGGMIHVLFVIAILVVLLRLMRRQNVFGTKT